MSAYRLFEPVLDLPLYPADPPLLRPEDAALREHVKPDEDFCRRVTDVSLPTLSFFPATGMAPRPCVLVCPGGGYGILAYNHEGTDVVHWLLANGFSAALLKYRCPDRRDQALADARRAMRLLRSRAGEWNLDATRIGILGFSAGAHLAVRTCCARDPEAPCGDEIDREPSRPDFAVVVYPAYIAKEGWGKDPGKGIDPDLEITAERVPPTFLVQSQDDFFWESSFAYAIAMRNAGVPFEMHVLPDGGHGWGIPRTGRSPDDWTDLAMRWLRRTAGPTTAR